VGIPEPFVYGNGKKDEGVGYTKYRNKLGSSGEYSDE